MLRKALIGFAATVLVGATFVPDDALARGFHGGFHGGFNRGFGFRGVGFRGGWWGPGWGWIWR